MAIEQGIQAGLTAFSNATGLSRAAGAVLPALGEAARRTGVDFSALYNTARLESAFNPQAKARTSSATGLFQFIDSTWLSTLARHGARHGITAGNRAQALALRRDPAVASLMAAEHMAENAATLSRKLGRAAEGAELYLAHFLGAGGAGRFLSAMAATPGMSAAALMPAAARANRAIFFDKGSGAARSLEQVFDLVSRRFAGAGAPPGTFSGSLGRRPGAPAPSATTRPIIAADPARKLPPADELAASRRAAQAAYLLLAELGA